jgi:hypothetical protein
MGNDVTLKVDSRVFYGLVALIAIALIFGIGLWLGDQMGADSATDPLASGGAPATMPAVPPAGATVPGMAPVGTPQVMPTAEPGKHPVKPEEVPVDEGQPRISVPEVAGTNWQYDFGSIPATDKVEKEFVIENVGKGVLEIQDASASCGCTAALVADSTVDPGGSTTIRVSYDPRVNQEFGKFVTKQIRIKSNDPLVPLAEFTITADVQAQ